MNTSWIDPSRGLPVEEPSSRRRSRRFVVAPSSTDAGVLGVVPGTIGMLQCLEAVKLITQFGTPLVGRLLVFDVLKSSFRHIAFERRPNCSACG